MRSGGRRRGARRAEGDNDALVAGAVRNLAPNAQGWIRTNCPLCELRTGKTDRRSSFGFSAVTMRFECYRCGATGRLQRALEEFADMAPLEAMEVAPPITGPPEGFYLLAEEPGASAVSLEPARRYLREQRHLSDGLIHEAQIGACATGWFAGRIVIPVIDPAGDWVWYVARDWTGNAEKKYLYPKGGRAGILYNHAALEVDTDEPVLVVEGCLDALAVWPDGVAVLGKPNDAQFAALVGTKRPVAVVLDGDAYDDAYVLAMRLRLEGQRAGAVRLPPKVDPDEVDLARLLQVCREAVDSGEATL